MSDYKRSGIIILEMKDYDTEQRTKFHDILVDLLQSLINCKKIFWRLKYFQNV